MKTSRANHPALKQLAQLYERMQQEYEATAAQAPGFSCSGCPENCCVSYFQHHTYIEWAFLWKGVRALSKDKKQDYLQRAEANVRKCQTALAQGLRPKVMCPLNDDGLCGLYAHRMMICRMHGTAHSLARPDGQVQAYPGCFRFQAAADENASPVLDRTPLYRELARLEQLFLGKAAGRAPKVDLTLAQMLAYGPPKLP